MVRLAGMAVLFAALLAITAACGTVEKPDFSEQVPAGAPQINQDALRFKPSAITVAAGEAVYFANNETAIHNVTLDGENLSGTMNRGDVFAYAFEAAGEYEVTCTIHPQMKATITVE